jgi:hypothetical protein
MVCDVWFGMMSVACGVWRVQCCVWCSGVDVVYGVAVWRVEGGGGV